MNQPPPLFDLHAVPEDERIRLIGETAMTGKVVGFMVDEGDGKPERYLEKLKQKFPTITVYSRQPGPVEGVVFIKVGPPRQRAN